MSAGSRGPPAISGKLASLFWLLAHGFQPIPANEAGTVPRYKLFIGLRKYHFFRDKLLLVPLRRKAEYKYLNKYVSKYKCWAVMLTTFLGESSIRYGEALVPSRPV